MILLLRELIRVHDNLFPFLQLFCILVITMNTSIAFVYNNHVSKIIGQCLYMAYTNTTYLQ
jgi:hypothetical protein